ncbi:hypothetical protein [Microvirga brassicacearum]|uniref:Uncharacterized protein n=1 Tax=Microvirga brassicacearum TaxID=2580413 RepID=A0A5N3PES4_9HYPH|nr:hypothetical protein [Microvirga brassicacearum]KAB0268155.1 hypothetical protein FEZ63_05890 [Microvirga brassicacearum]
MSEEEVECVAEELAKVGGVAWYPGREPNAILRVVSDRYRDRARVAIAALERLRASRQQSGTIELQSGEDPDFAGIVPMRTAEEIQVGSIVIYRPPGDLRAIACRVTKREGTAVYLVPCERADIGWVEINGIVPSAGHGERVEGEKANSEQG